jgi:hypothetical protein
MNDEMRHNHILTLVKKYNISYATFLYFWAVKSDRTNFIKFENEWLKWGFKK